MDGPHWKEAETRAAEIQSSNTYRGEYDLYTPIRGEYNPVSKAFILSSDDRKSILVAKVSGSSYVKSPHKGHSRPNLERGGDLLATGDVQYNEHTLFNKKS